MLPPPSIVTIKNRTRARPGEEENLEPERCPASARPSTASSLFVGLFLLSLYLAGCTPAGPRALLDGKRRIEQGHYKQAIEELRTATSLLVTNAQAWNYLGLAYHYAGQPAEAQKAYEQALALDRDLSEAHYNLGCLLLEQNKTNSAKNELTTYTLRRADSVDGLTKLGLAQLRARDLTGAEKSFNDALRLGPHHAPALNGLGLTRLQRGRAAEAAQMFNAAVKAQPAFPPALLNLAIVDQQYLKDRPAAARVYQAYLALKPAPENSDSVKAVLRQLDQEMAQPVRPATNPTPLTITNPAPRAATEPARSTPAPAPKPEPINEPKPALVPAPAPTNEYEVVRLAADPVVKPAQDIPALPRDALADPARPASPDPASDPKLAKRGLLQRVNPLNLFRNEPKPPETNASVVQTEKAAEIPSGGAGARYTYQSFSKPAAGNRTAAQPWFNQGVQAQQSHRVSEAMQAYGRATELDPAFFEAHYNQGLVSTEAENGAAALVAYQRALAIRPDSVDARYNFALLLKQSEFFTDAANELNRILASHPQDARTHLALGNLYAQQLGNPAKAREHYLKVLETDPRHPQAGAIRFWLSSNP